MISYGFSQRESGHTKILKTVYNICVAGQDLI